MDFEEPEDTSPSLSPSPSPSCNKYSDMLSQTDINVGDWVLVKFPVDNKNANIKQRVYIEKVTQKDGIHFEGTFLRKRPSAREKLGNIYVFPNIEDRSDFTSHQIIKKLNKWSERRGIFNFENIDTQKFEKL